MKIFSLAVLSLIAASSSSAAPAISAPSIEPISQVNANLYRGGEPTNEALEALKSLGVKTVINLEGGDLKSIYAPIVYFAEPGERASSIAKEGVEVTALQMNYRSYPLDSVGPVFRSENLTIAKILNDIENPELQPVYVHCQHGKDRTGLIVAIERVEVEGWSKEAARAEWIKDGHGFFSRILTGWLDLYFESNKVAGNE